MSVFGVDIAWGRPGVAALTKAGVKFTCRYLSHDTSGKNLTRAEAKQLGDAGIWIVAVWESTANRALAGHSAGVADAREAEKQAKACGMPADRPIYFAADWDATPSQQDEIHAYLDGAASVVGRPRVGLYAGYGPIKRAFDAKKITYGWQTYAWSGGKWDTRAQLQQYKNDMVMNKVGLDYDRAMVADYGQWMIGRVPPKPLPAATAPPFPGRILIARKPEMTGPDVLAWQRQMRLRGWSLRVDGHYKPEDAAVCGAFQRDSTAHGWPLDDDGKVGSLTWTAVFERAVT